VALSARASTLTFCSLRSLAAFRASCIAACCSGVILRRLALPPFAPISARYFLKCFFMRFRECQRCAESIWVGTAYASSIQRISRQLLALGRNQTSVTIFAPNIWM